MQAFLFAYVTVILYNMLETRKYRNKLSVLWSNGNSFAVFLNTRKQEKISQNDCIPLFTPVEYFCLPKLSERWQLRGNISLCPPLPYGENFFWGPNISLFRWNKILLYFWVFPPFFRTRKRRWKLSKKMEVGIREIYSGLVCIHLLSEIALYPSMTFFLGDNTHCWRSGDLGSESGPSHAFCLTCGEKS